MPTEPSLQHPTPWRAERSTAGNGEPYSYILDANGTFVALYGAADPDIKEMVVRAVNLVSWLSPETIAKLEEVRAEFERMRKAVTA